MSATITPLFDFDTIPVERPQPAPEATSDAPVFVRPEDALGRVSIALIGEGAEGLGTVLRERAIAERMNVLSRVSDASRLLAARRGRAVDTWLPAVLFTDTVSDEVEGLVLAARYGITVVLWLDGLDDIGELHPRAKRLVTTFEMRQLLEVAA